MVYEDFKELPKRTAADKALRDKAIHIAKNLTYDGYPKGLTSMIYHFLDTKTSNTNRGTWINSDVVSENKHPLNLAAR